MVPIKKIISDMYHNDQGEKGIPMGWVVNKSVGKGVGSMKKIGLKMIGIALIRAKRGIQWDRSQIRVHVGPLIFFLFYSNLNDTALLEFPNS